MKKNIYFHIELKEGNGYNLVASAYKNEELQSENTGNLKETEYKSLLSDDKVSSDLFREVSRNVYGAPLSEKSRVTIREIGDTANLEFGILDLHAFYSTKRSERASIIREVDSILYGYGVRSIDSDKYRIIVEIEQ